MSDIDNMLDEVRNEIQNDKPTSKWTEVLKNLGYSVSESKDGQITIAKDKNTYTLSIIDSSIHSDTHFRVPLKSENVKQETVLETTSRCIGFYQKDYKNGTLFQFKVADLIPIVKPLMERLLLNKQIAFSAAKAIEQKRVHVESHDDSGYMYYVYIPISALCEKVKNISHEVGRVS